MLTVCVKMCLRVQLLSGFDNDDTVALYRRASNGDWELGDLLTVSGVTASAYFGTSVAQFNGTVILSYHLYIWVARGW